MTVAYSARQAAELIGITYRQLDYWDRTHLVRPSIKSAAGSGSRRRYSLEDLYRLAVVRCLLDWGMRLEAVRQVARQLADADADAYLVIAGGTITPIRDPAELHAAVPPGVSMYHVLSLRAVRATVDHELAATTTTTDEDRVPA